MELRIFFNKYTAKIAPVAFIILTFIFCITRIPFYDEAHAYLISRLNLDEIFYLTRIEGHPILWFLILKPFNNLNLYPYSILLINWFFASCMILVFWRFAPFNNLIKLLITFSFPFFQYFGMIARPYTLGVLIIFLLCSLYKQSMKKPVLYAFLLCLCANLTIMTLFVAFAFGVLFLYDIIKSKALSKKQLIIVFSMFGACFLFLCAQFAFCERPTIQSSEAHELFWKYFQYFLYKPFSDIQSKNIFQILSQLTGCISLYYMPYIFFKRYKKSLCFSLLAIAPMLYLWMKIFICNFWHYYFVFVVLICAIWIGWDKFKNIKFLNVLFILVILSNMTSLSISRDGRIVTKETIIYEKLKNNILNNEKYKNAKLFCFNNYTYIAPGLLPYFEQKNITLYDSHNNNRAGFENIKNIQNREYQHFDAKEFYNYVDKTKENYLLATSNVMANYQDFSVKKGNIMIHFDLIETHPEYYLLIFKIRRQKL